LQGYKFSHLREILCSNGTAVEINIIPQVRRVDISLIDVSAISVIIVVVNLSFLICSLVLEKRKERKKDILAAIEN